MSAESPTAVMATVFPPPFGPETMSARAGGSSRTWLATTFLPCRTRSGWRRDRSSKPRRSAATHLGRVRVEVRGEQRRRLEHVERGEDVEVAGERARAGRERLG